MPVEDFIINVLCLVDELLPKIVKQKLRARGPAPKLTDSEIITMEIVGEFLGYHEDKAIWQYFSMHWKSWFPGLGSRKTFVTQANNLWRIKEKMHGIIAKDKLSAMLDDVHLFDGFPMPVCHFRRANFAKIFRGHASFGYCASKQETYYGFKGHLLVTMSGIATEFTVTAANVDEREALPELTDNIQGLLIADRGLIGQELKDELSKKGVDLQTPLRSNMKDTRSAEFVKKIVSVRRLVETVIGQLTDRYQIQKIKAKTLEHFLRRVTRKILSHTAAFLINKAANPLSALQLNLLITS